MTKNPKTLLICQSCGFQTGKWLGKCPECQAWSSCLEEVLITEPAYLRTPVAAASRQPAPRGEHAVGTLPELRERTLAQFLLTF